jgi:hypothetical protein
VTDGGVEQRERELKGRGKTTIRECDTKVMRKRRKFDTEGKE